MKMPEGPQRKGHVEEQIDEAIKRGEFENLKGKGKPLKLWGDLTDRRVMREKLARDVGEGAPWEGVAAEIGYATRRVEAELKRALEFRRAGMASPRADKAKIENDFRAQLRALEVSIKSVNSLILKHNLLIPTALPKLHRVRLKLSDLMEKWAPEIENPR